MKNPLNWLKRTSKLDADDPHRDWRLIEQVVNEAFAEQRRSRRWGVFFKLLTFAYLFGAVFLFMPRGADFPSVGEPHVAAVQLTGMIAEDYEANADAVVTAMRRAFESENAEAVMLVINSPGGSPVQAGYIVDEINRLRDKHPAKKVYAVIKEMGASGGYYVASAADAIYANKASLVGSIGVTASGFGFVETLDKLGVERRHFTSGEHKAFLDPFSPLKEDEKAFWQDVLKDVHQQFIDVVRAGRGDKLQETPELFSGLIWNGEQALELGLIDGLGSPGQVARDVIGVEEIHDYTVRPNPFQQAFGGLGVAIGEGMARFLTEQAPPTLR